MGCAATGTIESFVVNETTKEVLDWKNKLQILNPQQYTLEDGTTPFPHTISTPLVSGFPFQALPHVPTPVMLVVQEALLQMQPLAKIATTYLACLECQGDHANNTDCLDQNDLTAFTAEQALDAYYALQESDLIGFTKPISNIILRNIQQATGFLIQSTTSSETIATEVDTTATGDLSVAGSPPIHIKNNSKIVSFSDPSASNGHCVRFSSIVDAVTCPPGHFVRTSEEIRNKCNQTGLDCYGNDCICQPCVKAFQVDVFTTPLDDDDDDDDETMTIMSQQYPSPSLTIGRGCLKFSVCGRVQQEHVLRIYAVDNVGRINATITGVFLASGGDVKGTEEDSVGGEIPFTFQRTTIANHTDIFHYDYLSTRTPVGTKIIQVFLNGQEIPQSPFRLWVAKRDCATDTGNGGLVPDEFGECICPPETVEVGGNCVPLSTLLPSIVVPLLVLLTVSVYGYIKYKQKQMDFIWKIHPDELKFDDNPRVLGCGTFGVVLLAEFRGTAVAVKRVLPHKNAASSSASSATGKKGDIEQPQNLINIFEDQSQRCHSNDHQSKSKDASLNEGFTQTKMVRKVGTGKIASTTTQREFTREMRLLSKLRHPSITTIMGAVKMTEDSMMVMEFMHLGSLYDLLRNEKVFLDDRSLVHMLLEVVSGLRFLHTSKPQVVHGDLKAKNILVDEKFRAKVADFGLARHKGYWGSKKATGTPLWMAPELIRGVSVNTAESDVYSFGIVLYEVFSRKDPYEGEHHEGLLREIANKTVSKRPIIPPSCPPEAASLMTACWDGEPVRRPLAADLSIQLRMIDITQCDGGHALSPSFGAPIAFPHTKDDGAVDKDEDDDHQTNLISDQMMSSTAWRLLDRK